MLISIRISIESNAFQFVMLIILKRLIHKSRTPFAATSAIYSLQILLAHLWILVEWLHTRLILFDDSLLCHQFVAITILIGAYRLQSSGHIIVVVMRRMRVLVPTTTMSSLVSTRAPTIKQPTILASNAAGKAWQTPRTTHLASKGVDVSEAYVEERVETAIDEFQNQERHFDRVVEVLSSQVMLDVLVPKENASIYLYIYRITV